MLLDQHGRLTLIKWGSPCFVSLCIKSFESQDDAIDGPKGQIRNKFPQKAQLFPKFLQKVSPKQAEDPRKPRNIQTFGENFLNFFDLWSSNGMPCYAL